MSLLLVEQLNLFDVTFRCVAQFVRSMTIRKFAMKLKEPMDAVFHDENFSASLALPVSGMFGTTTTVPKMESQG